ncbi:MAG: class I SAM-dependent methyltransferase [Thermodesulfobacteriota bacterium]
MEYLLFSIEAALVSACVVGGYFFLVTRGSLVIKSLLGDRGRESHIYWIYSNRFLIWLTDRQPVISAILLFNYRRLADKVARDLNPSLEGKSVLQVSCAFGNISQKIARKCRAEGAKRLVITDLLANELNHTKVKCERAVDGGRRFFVREDAVNLAHGDGSFDYVVLFFLFHELPLPMKALALKEAARVVKPGGRILFGEFHRPVPWLLRVSGRLFFKVFEPYAIEMWDGFDPVRVLNDETPDRWDFAKTTYFGGNYQVFSARKM